MKHLLAILLLLVLIAPVVRAQKNLDWATPANVEAQEEGPAIENVAGAPGLPSDPTPVPVDGGLVLLGAAGAAYAVRRLRARRATA